MDNIFVFLHVGADSSMPSTLARSIRRLMPDAKIIQCSDAASPAAKDINSIFRISVDQPAHLMHVRLQAFTELGLTSPALYIDTDMLMIQPIEINNLLKNSDAALCRRDFDRDGIFNFNLKNLNFEEYAGWTLDQAFPFVACATATSSFEFWEDCLFALDIMDEKYHQWYGDQEALKVVAQSPRHKISYLPERLYGCLPEQFIPSSTPYLMHFKGINRKHLFDEWSTKLGLSNLDEGTDI